MSNYCDHITNDIDEINSLLSAIPFAKDQGLKGSFANIYHVDYEGLSRLNKQQERFPIDPSKLLKLGISLGNLIKSLQTDEEMYRQQQQQQQNFVNNLNNFKNNRTTFQSSSPLINGNSFQGPSEPNPFNVRESANSGYTSPQYPPYQVKFIRNLLSILKNFDIGSNRGHSGSSAKISDPSGSQSGASNQLSRTSSSNISPIKLTSKQLLIEKLEINISLDSLFIYKILLRLLVNIYSVLQKNLINDSSVDLYNNNYLSDETSSIFSTNSDISSESVISHDEYLRVLRVVLDRVRRGIIDPLMNLILIEICQPHLDKEFSQLIDSL